MAIEQTVRTSVLRAVQQETYIFKNHLIVDYNTYWINLDCQESLEFLTRLDIGKGKVTFIVH